MARLLTDHALICITLWQEARGEGQDGLVAVAEVIRNRLQRRYQSDGTVVGTVLAPFQFSGWNTNARHRAASCRLEDEDPVVQACAAAWETALAGSMTVAGAVLYYNPAVVTPHWATRCVETAVIGRHRFLRPAEW